MPEFDLATVTRTGQHRISPESAATFDVPEYDDEIYTIYRLLCNGQIKKASYPTFPTGMMEYLGQLRALTEKKDVSGLSHRGPVHNCWVLFVRREEITESVVFTMDSGEHTCGEH